MDRNLPLKPTLAFLACIVLIIGALFYFAPVTVKPPIGQLYRNANDELIALESHYLVDLSEQSETVSMAPFLQGSHVGQLIPLRTGELIINGKGQSRNILLNFKSLFRLPDTENTATSSLLKCDARITNCQPWGDGGLFFRMGWSGLELQNGQIIINDSTRHRVLLLLRDGNILSELAGFKFPNHAVEFNDTIWITDTNHNQIVAIRARDGKLTRTGEVISLDSYAGIQYQHRFPSIAQLDGDNQWWVMINDNAMAHPGIYRLNDDKTATQIAANINDATSIWVEDSQLFLASYPENQVWRFDTQTLTGTVFPNTHLSKINQTVENEIATQKMTLWSIITGIGIVALGFLIYAIKGSKPVVRETVHLTKPTEVSVSLPQKNRDTVWIAKNSSYLGNVKKAKIAVILLPVALVSIVISLVLLAFFTNVPISSSFILLIPLVLFLVLLTKKLLSPVIYSALNVDIGVQEGKLILRDNHTKKVAYVFGKDIVYSKTAFIADSQLFQVINPQAGTHFDSKTFKRYALPIIQQGEHVNEWQLFVKTLALKP